MAKQNPAETALTEAEVREAFAKIKTQREKDRVREQEYNARPEVKERQKEAAKKARDKRKAILKAAKDLGLEL